VAAPRRRTRLDRRALRGLALGEPVRHAEGQSSRGTIMTQQMHSARGDPRRGNSRSHGARGPEQLIFRGERAATNPLGIDGGACRLSRAGAVGDSCMGRPIGWSLTTFPNPISPPSRGGSGRDRQPGRRPGALGPAAARDVACLGPRRGSVGVTPAGVPNNPSAGRTGSKDCVAVRIHWPASTQRAIVDTRLPNHITRRATWYHAHPRTRAAGLAGRRNAGHRQ
jgi:hypothetical protein